MVERVGRSSYPWWVRFARWGTPGRSWQWAWFTVSVVLAVSCVVIGFLAGDSWFKGAAFLLPAAWYWLSIQWVDRHGSWTDDAHVSVSR